MSLGRARPRFVPWLLALTFVAGSVGRASAQAPDTPLTVWRDGEARQNATVATARARGLLVLDLGEAWVPDLFAGENAGGAGPEHHYAQSFRRLAREDFPNDLQGARARFDRYLELYGIPPTLSVLRGRLREVRERDCVQALDWEGLRTFPGAAVDEDDRVPVDLTLYRSLDPLVERALVRGEALVPAELDRDALSTRERYWLARHRDVRRWRRFLSALRERLRCDGHVRWRLPEELSFDRVTRAALAEFERRHRIYSRGSLGGATLEALGTHPLELERQALVRVLTERAKLDAGVIEDGSVSEVPNLELRIAEHVERAFGLQDPESAWQWLEALGELDDEGHRFVAIEGIELPYYYGPEMDLHAEIDRGDVWYELPFEPDGSPRYQPVEQGPMLTLFVRHAGRSIPLVRHRTTIGGWRIETDGREQYWVYKESPVGERVWGRIVSAPVWMPPPSTPPTSLVTELRRDDEGRLVRELNRNIVGPGYASAYGLVAAYHRRFERRPDGSIRLGKDEGIRTHGTVDYTSVWRRPSHGCHRLYNHLAIRLFSFVLAHRAHRRVGHRPARYRLPVAAQGFEGTVRIDETGYVFELREPIAVEVTRGRIRGSVQRPPTQRVEVMPEHLDAK